jgi:hypothetical protein
MVEKHESGVRCSQPASDGIRAFTVEILFKPERGFWEYPAVYLLQKL